ncbi:hypothetical protein F5Y19DRAFT_342754 [Xylariaceae sp. FL1651]|nr:hypothetical protein F5Y19DRAFT_342754 [Xylariaceae sp. FL1651]
MAGHRDSLIGANVLFLVLDGLVVGARVYVRTKLITRGFGWDDFVLCLTYIGYAISAGFGFASMYYGYAAEDKQPYYDPAKVTQFTYANQTTLYIAAGLVKVAVALVLFRLAVGKGIRRVLIGSMVIVGIWTIITVLFASWLCATSGTSNWAGSATCTRVGYFRTISNIFIDYFYALVPVYILRHNQMKLRLKLIVIFLLGLGVFASSATIVKLVIIVRLPYATGKDAKSLHYDLLLWADIEIGLAILATSAAALRPLLRHLSIIRDATPKQGSSGTDESGPYHELAVSRQITNPKKRDSGMVTVGRLRSHEGHDSISLAAASEDRLV